MTRVPEVIDCWYDSGAMPFAQWGYPHQGAEEFKEQFPADFISEAIDQTRGWFYSQLAISTLLFGKEGVAEQNFDFPHPFKNCIVLGLMLSEWWKGQGDAGGMYLTPAEANAADEKTEHHVGKMSKSKRNYREPQGIFDKYGADALRWYFFANQPPWTSIRYSERQIKESMPEFLLRLWNVYSFFVLYANIDEFSPEVESGDNFDPKNLASGQGYRPVEERGELDRWVISELHRTVDAVVTSMDAYDNYGACTQLTAFVEGLSNWFVRRSRDRFWAKDKTAPEKLDAYWTLFECLTTTAKLIAPFVPFMSETLWQNLTAAAGGGRESVHLCDYPTADSKVIDDDLSRRMSILREVASLGLSARMAEKLKVRQPLSGVTVVLNDGQDQAWLEQHDELLKTELNVQAVTYTVDAGEFVTYVVVPNFKRLGPRVGKLMPKLKQAFAAADGAAMLADLTANGKTSLTVESEQIELDSEDIEVRLKANDGWAAAQGSQAVVILSTELTPELIRSGYAREINRYVQDRRKELDLERTDRIDVWIKTDSDEIKQAIEENSDYLKGETLATSITLSACDDSSVEPCEVTVGEHNVTIWIRVTT